MASAIYQISDALSFMRLSVGGCYTAIPGGAVIKRRLPTDPVGSAAVTFQGVQAGTEIRVYLPDGTEAAGVEDCTADPVLTWPVYAAGSPNNSVTIRIIHTAYKIKEFAYTSTVGNVSIPVQQESDRWYKNPI